MIGRFSVLSVSDVCHITNYYNGICSKYIMYKDNTKICIDKLFEATTTEENGLEIDVDTKVLKYASYSTRINIIDGINHLTFYNNVYVDDSEGLLSTNIDSFNKRKIKEFDTFKICDTDEINNSIIMGNVLYPIDNGIIQNWFEGINSLPIAIKCNIGDIDITPNREALIYNDKTLDTLNSRCKAALNELKEIAKKQFTMDFNTVQEYYDFSVHDYIPVKLYTFDENTSITIDIPKDKISYYGLSNQMTLKGKPIPRELLTYYRQLIYCKFPYNAVLYCYHKEKFYIKNNYLSLKEFITAYNYSNLYIVDEPLKPIVKKYFNEQHHSWRVVYFLYSKHLYSAFRRIISDICKSYQIKPTNPVLKLIVKDFKENYSNIPTYSIANVPQSYIDTFKASRKAAKTSTQQKARKCVIYKLIQNNRAEVSYDSQSLSYEDIVKFKGTVFFAEKGNYYMEAFYPLFLNTTFIKTIFVEVAPRNLPALTNLKNCIDFNSIFTTKNNIISKLCTYIYLSEKYNIDKSTSIWSDYSAKDYPEWAKLEYLINIVSRYRYTLICENDTCNKLLKTLCKTYYENKWLNYDIISTIESNTEYMKVYSIFKDSPFSNYKDFVLAFCLYLNKHDISNQKKLNKIKNILKPILNEYTPNKELSHFDIG